MMLVEENQVPEAVLPVEALKRHLRMGTGFAEDDLQDTVLASFLRAAISAIEARTGKALITRGFVASFSAWRDMAGQVLPVAPVQAITDLTLVDRFGATSTVDPGQYRLEADAQCPRLRPMALALPNVPSNGAVEIRFDAGFAADFDAMPSDLAQAVLLLAAHYYEYRNETALSQGCMPFGVTSLIARYRSVRVGMGA